MNDARLQRWRLVLGEGAQSLGQLSGQAERQDRALGYLYDRETVAGAGQQGGRGDSTLEVPEWINSVHELFPNAVVDVLQRDALERYGIVEVVTDVEALERVEPSETLLRAILATKHLMNDEVLAAAREIVRAVVAQLVEKLRVEVRRAVVGKRDPHRRSRHQVAANFDPRATIRANLKHYDADHGLVIREPLFVSRTARRNERWQLIIAVDQSGSMASSVIYSAVMASIFHQIPSLRSHLLAFDTNVVDLTDEVADPVETLMRVQLGGGTDIARAMAYAADLVDEPRRAMVVLITDLYEGGEVHRLRSIVAALVAQGTRVLVLGAMNERGDADYDHTLGSQLVALGAQVGAMTPYELASWVGEAFA